MRTTHTIAIQLLAAGMMLLGNAPAQQTPAATPPSSTPQSSGAAKTPSTAAKKPATTTTTVTLKTPKEKTSYALGMKIGGDLRRQGLTSEVDPALTARGLRDALGGSKTALTEDEMKAVLTQLQNTMRGKMQEKMHEASAASRKEGDAFLAANKAKPGVTTLPSGLQYKVITQGTGAKPTANDTVTVNYRGTLVNGKEFDSSYKRGEPVSFPVDKVIKGWTEALQLMPVGSKWELYIPPDLAYGDGGQGDIPPGSTLIFEVELISIGEKK